MLNILNMNGIRQFDSADPSYDHFMNALDIIEDIHNKTIENIRNWVAFHGSQEELEQIMIAANNSEADIFDKAVKEIIEANKLY